MTPEQIVSHFTEIIVADPSLHWDEIIHTAMMQLNIPEESAERTLTLIQIAWGRVFLNGIGVKLSPDYMVFDANGEIVEQGELDSEPHIASAYKIAPRFWETPGFKALAFSAPDFRSVSEALRGGSKPEDLTTALSLWFTQTPTEEGKRRAQQTVNAFLQSFSDAHSKH